MLSNRAVPVVALSATLLSASGTAALAAPARSSGLAAAARPAAFITTAGTLDGIAVTSASNAWAVGSTSAVRSGALILRWNGAAWR